MSKKKQSRAKKPAPIPKAKSPRPVPLHEQQYALIGGVLLDVEAAFRLLRATPRRAARIDVDAWARLYGMDGGLNAPIRVGPLFDPDHAATADLRRPLILVTLTLDESEEVQLIADGSHRLFRAFREGRSTLLAWVLTATETQAITIAGPTLKDSATK
ncbi:hypothetical protein ABIA31_002897 [Catenulispora sp. MAP5-51]|uniref:hypothetical protein n=1 Tax=Catenulispora sp. MAP5-51 TaxID=3156298 RepID=UPI0035187746